VSCLGSVYPSIEIVLWEGGATFSSKLNQSECVPDHAFLSTVEVYVDFTSNYLMHIYFMVSNCTT
jgi:hypothetical protein